MLIQRIFLSCLLISGIVVASSADKTPVNQEKSSEELYGLSSEALWDHFYTVFLPQNFPKAKEDEHNRLFSEYLKEHQKAYQTCFTYKAYCLLIRDEFKKKRAEQEKQERRNKLLEIGCKKANDWAVKKSGVLLYCDKPADKHTKKIGPSKKQTELVDAELERRKAALQKQLKTQVTDEQEKAADQEVAAISKNKQNTSTPDPVKHLRKSAEIKKTEEKHASN